jgi:O-antigen/teichoic acid export membrane protein
MSEPLSSAARAQPDAEAENAEMKNMVSQSVTVNVAARAFYILTRFFLPPLTLSYVTLEEYGVWAACFILIGYLGMSAFGVSNVYVRYIAQYHTRNESDKINRLLSTGLIVITALSVVLLIGLWFALPAMIVRFNIPASLHHTAFILIFVTSAAFLVDLSFGAFAYALTGVQRITEQTLINVASFSLEAVLIVTLLVRGHGIYSLLWAYVVRTLVATVGYIVLCYRVLPELSIRFSYFDREMLRLFYSYGAVVQLSGLMGMFLYSVEKVIAGVFVGVRATGLLDIGEKLPMMASQVPASMNAVFLPVMSRLHTGAQTREIARLYLMGARYLNLMMGGVLGFLAAFSFPIITAWIGVDEKYHTAALILTLVCLPYQLNELTGPASAYHRSVGKPARELFYPVLQLLLVIATVGIGFAWKGKTVIVICVAVSLSMVISSLAYQMFTNRYLQLGAGEYLRQVLAPGVAPYAIGYGVARLTNPLIAWSGDARWRLVPVLAVCGAIYGLIFVALFYRVMCDWEEREYLRKQLSHTLGGLMRLGAKPA